MKMRRPSVPPPPPLLLLLLTLATLSPEAAASLYRFRPAALCPPSTAAPASQLLQGVRSEATCSVECALRPDCAVYNYSSSASQCRMASTEELLTAWLPSTPGTPCASQLSPRLPGALSFAKQLIAYLDFRVGQTNLVNASRFSVTGQSPGVTFDSAGAAFSSVPSGASNFVQLNTNDGGSVPFGDLLGRGRNFSLYARTQRLANRTQMYHMLGNCYNFTSFQGGFAHHMGHVAALHGITGPNELKFQLSNETLVEVTGQTINVSAGVVFEQNQFTASYYNGRLMPMVNMTDNDTQFSGKPECIRLGYNPEQGQSLVGRFICYAIVGKALSAQEFEELDGLCANG